MFKFLWALPLILFNGFSSLSASPTSVSYTMDDFAYTATLTEAETSLRQIEVPLALYQKMQRRDYGDLRVFSADGQIVPHQFSLPIQRESLHKEVPLAFYPLSKEEAESSSNIQVTITQQSGNKQLRVNQQLNDSNHRMSAEYQYIIENKKNIPPVCKLELDWTQTKSNSIIGFKLESSQKLQNWTMLSSKLTVSKLNYSGSQLIHNQVSFPCTSHNYLRLTWLQPNQKIQLVQVKGIYEHQGKKTFQWANVGKPNNRQEEGVWLFESPVIATVSRLKFITLSDGLFYKGRLYSRNSQKEAWRYRAEVNQYRLNLGETSLQSDVLHFSPTNDRFWKVALKTEGSFKQAQLPEIKMGWQPKSLYFLAQGNEPFKIAFGHPKIDPAQNNELESLIHSLNESGTRIDTVTLKDTTNHNKTFKSESNIPWKLILLWSVLILGTLLMAFMAYRLYQQMNGKSG